MWTGQSDASNGIFLESKKCEANLDSIVSSNCASGILPTEEVLSKFIYF